MMNLLVAAAYLLFAGVVVGLVQAYLRTRNVGFIWLGVAVLVWPFASPLLAPALGRLSGLPAGPAVALVRLVQQVSTLFLLLVTVRLLGRTDGNRSAHS